MAKEEAFCRSVASKIVIRGTEVMVKQTESFLGTTTRAEALRDFEEISIRIEHAEPNCVHAYTKANVPSFERCSNPRCQQGGIDLQQVIEFWEPGTTTISCEGHEGSLQGRRRGMPCENQFTVSFSRKLRSGS